MVFKGFLPKFQKNSRFFFLEFCRIPKKPRFLRFSTKMSKKTLGFPKFQKFQDEAYLPKYFRTCCACTCKDYVCKHTQPKWHCHFGSSAFDHASEKNLKVFLSTPSICAIAMSGAPMNLESVIPEAAQGSIPVEAPTTLASGSVDSFHHVEAVMKDDNVSTGTLDSQDWEMVTEMVEDTDNAATHFMQGKHVIDLEGPAPNLQDSIEKMMSTMEKMKLGSTASGVEAPSRPEGVASAAAVPSAAAAPMDDSVVEQTTHKWKVFGRGTPSSTYILAEVPFSMEAVTKDIKLMVDKLSAEEIYDLFVKFCDSESIPAVSFGRVVKAYVAMKAQKVHDEVMKQPHVAGRSRPGVGSDARRTLSLSHLQHTNAQRRRCASVARRSSPSRGQNTWSTWTIPRGIGCSL